MNKGGAVATTAQGDNPKRAESATGASLLNIYSERPLLRPNAYKGYRQLIVKDNQTKIISDRFDLLRVAKYICSLAGMIMTDNYVFEYGKQNRLHIHSIIKAPKLYNLSEMTEKMRKQQFLKYDIERITDDNYYLEERKLDLSSYTFEILLFSCNEHMFYDIEEYFRKEQTTPHLGCIECPFTDDYGPNPMEDVIKSAFANL